MGEDALLDFASRPITASYTVTWTSLAQAFPCTVWETEAQMREGLCPRSQGEFAAEPGLVLSSAILPCPLPWPCLPKPGVGPPLGLVSRGHSPVHSGVHQAPVQYPSSSPEA